MFLSPFVRISRPVNSLAIGTLVVASYLVASSGTGFSFITMTLTALGSVLIAAGGYALNDVFDYETDKVIHKERVLPKGELRKRIAKFYALTLLIGSPFLFLFINHLSFVNASLASLLLFLYSWKLKSTSGIIGNLSTALLAVNGALIGGFIVGSLSNVIPFAACVFFATISREIVKDVEDLPGDIRSRAQTIPILVGSKNASRLAAFFLFLAIPTTYFPYQHSNFNRAYLIAASIVNIAVFFTAISLGLKKNKGISQFQRLIKGEMFLYIIIFLMVALLDLILGG